MLDELHDIVKRLDALLTQREPGINVWWKFLGSVLSDLERFLKKVEKDWKA